VITKDATTHQTLDAPCLEAKMSLVGYFTKYHSHFTVQWQIWMGQWKNFWNNFLYGNG